MADDHTRQDTDRGANGSAKTGTGTADDSAASGAGAAGTVTPGELDITNKTSVVSIEPGRYVISPSGRRPDMPDGEIVDDGDPGRAGADQTQTQAQAHAQADPDTADETHHQQESELKPKPVPAATRGRVENGDTHQRFPERNNTDSAAVTQLTAEQQLVETACATESIYTVFIQGDLEGTPTRDRVESDSIVATFDKLLRWYSDRVSPDDTHHEVALGRLLEQSTAVESASQAAEKD